MTNWEKEFDKKFGPLHSYKWCVGVPTSKEPVTSVRIIANREIKDFIHKREKELLEDQIEFLRRLKLGFDVWVCDCGDKWKDSDGADMVEERLKALSNAEVDKQPVSNCCGKPITESGFCVGCKEPCEELSNEL